MDDPAERRQLDQFLQYPVAYARQALRYAQELGIAPERLVRSSDAVRAVAQGHSLESALAEFTGGVRPRLGKPVRPRPGPMVIRDRTFVWGSRTYVMAIVNVTPDSFSGDAVGTAPGAIREKIEEAISGGADLIDIGGESTRPGATKVSASEEMDRVLPAVAIAREMTELPVSIDTYKAEVARAAIGAGADMVNDVWGTTADPEMAATVASLGCPLVITHNRAATVRQGEIGEHFGEVDYGDVVGSIYTALEHLLIAATSAGISGEKIILDPGIGFGKTPPQKRGAHGPPGNNKWPGATVARGGVPEIVHRLRARRWPGRSLGGNHGGQYGRHRSGRGYHSRARRSAGRPGRQSDGFHSWQNIRRRPD